MARTHQDPPTVRFYQLATTPLEKVLVGVLEKAWTRKMLICLLAHDTTHAQALDDLLWRVPHGGFLPHGQWNRPDPERQPILISLEPDERNGASVIVLTTPRLLPDPARFDLVIDFVCGQDPMTLAESRKRYRHYKDLACNMEYWTKTPQGKWQRVNTGSA